MKRWAALGVLLLAACGQPVAHQAAKATPAVASAPVVVTPIPPPATGPATGPRLATPPRIATVARLAGLPGTELVAVADDPNQAIHFFTLDGREVLSVNLVDGLRFIGGVHGEPYFVDPQGYVSAIRRDGTGALVLATSQSWPLFSPDFQSWSYASAQWNQPEIHSDVHVAGVVAAGQPGGDRVIASSTEQGRELRPYRWTSQGLWLTHGAVGIGGYILFDSPFGVVDLLDPQTGAIITTLDCQSFDRAADGTVACVSYHYPASPGPPTVTLTVSRNGKDSVSVPLSTPNFLQAGDVNFLPSGGKVVLAGAVGNPDNEHFETDVVDLATGKRSILIDGYRPAASHDSVLPDGRLLVSRGWDMKYGSRGFGILSADGKVTTITTSGQVVGVVRP